jgi:hypothetical protein
MNEDLRRSGVIGGEGGEEERDGGRDLESAMSRQERNWEESTSGVARN